MWIKPASPFVRDHPRRCGENGHCRTCRRFRRGSPPQVRGKRFPHDEHCLSHRITPAGAGKTFLMPPQRSDSQDHPRRCGENEILFLAAIPAIGSPPQVRGKLSTLKSQIKGIRITPAGAGKTLKRSFRNQPFCSRAVQISFNFSNSLNVSLQSGSAR